MQAVTYVIRGTQHVWSFSFAVGESDDPLAGPNPLTVRFARHSRTKVYVSRESSVRELAYKLILWVGP